MSVITKGFALIALTAFCLVGCGGSSGGGSSSGAKLKGPTAPLLEDLASALDINTGAFGGTGKPAATDPNTDRLTRPRPNDLDGFGRGGTIVGDGYGLDDLNQKNSDSSFDQDGRPYIDGPGKGGGDDIVDNTIELSERAFPSDLTLGRPTVIPPTIDPPYEPVPQRLSSNKDTFDKWAINAPPPGGGGGIRPPEAGNSRILSAPPVTGNYPGAITVGGDNKKGGDNGTEEPVPEPSTIILMLVGLFSLWRLYKR